VRFFLAAFIPLAGILGLDAPALVPGSTPPQENAYVSVMDGLPAVDGADPVRYALFVPAGLEPGRPTPLILALHFGGEPTPTYGRDFVEMLIRPGLGGLGAIIVAPNCPGADWRDPASENAVFKILDAVSRRFPIDARRVAVVGYSMGAAGAYHLGARYPDRFSAVVAISGLPNSSDLAGLTKVPVYAIHSADDEVFPIHEALAIYGELKRQGVSIEADILHGMTHGQTPRFVPALKKAMDWLGRIWKAAGS